MDTTSLEVFAMTPVALVWVKVELKVAVAEWADGQPATEAITAPATTAPRSNTNGETPRQAAAAMTADATRRPGWIFATGRPNETRVTARSPTAAAPA